MMAYVLVGAIALALSFLVAMTTWAAITRKED